MTIPQPRLGVLLVALACSSALATTRIAVSFDDPAALYAPYHADLERVTQAAGAHWLDHFAFVAPGAELEVRIGFAPIATATGRSMSSAFLWTDATGIDVFEQGAAHELRTGIDVNGGAADIEFVFGIGGYLQQELWFDPDAALRVAAVPADRTDAVSVLLHEFGHALGFNGWRDPFTGALAGRFQSTFDAHVAARPGIAGPTLFFEGEAAVQHYGAPVPLSFGNYGHVGNPGAGPGQDLVPDLMNGIVFHRGARYAISDLDLRILQDIGLPVTAAVPEPGSGALWLVGAGLLAALSRRAASRGGRPPAPGGAGCPPRGRVPARGAAARRVRPAGRTGAG